MLHTDRLSKRFGGSAMMTPGSIRNVFPARIPPPHPTIDWISCEPLRRKYNLNYRTLQQPHSAQVCKNKKEK